MYNEYRVIKEITGVEKALWFARPGGGMQYKLPTSIEKLIEEGVHRINSEIA